MLGAVMSAMVEEDPLRRAHRLHLALGRLTSPELAALFLKAIAVKDNSRRHMLLVHLLTQWIEVDATAPREALRPYWDQFRNGKGLRLTDQAEAVLKAWAAVAPDEVFAQVVANASKPGARSLAEAALSAMAAKDPQRQFEALARLPASPLRDVLSTPAIKALAQKDYSAAEAQLDLLSGRQRLVVHTEILEALAKRDPAAGLARLADLAPGLPPSTSGLRLMTPVLQVAASGNREAAFALVAQLPEALQRSAIGTILTGWAGTDPVEALKWSAEHGIDPGTEAWGNLDFSGDSVHAAQSMLAVAFKRDFSKTFDWILAQPSSPQRDRWLSWGLGSQDFKQTLQAFDSLSPEAQASNADYIVRSCYNPFLGNTNVSKVESWVKALPPGDTRAAAIRAMVDRQADQAPERVDEILNEWPTGPDREAALGGVASYLTWKNPARAVEFARQLTDPTARVTAFDLIARGWSYSDRAAVLRWIADEPAFSAVQKRVLLRMYGE
jgi:hypothetical protein